MHLLIFCTKAHFCNGTLRAEEIVEYFGHGGDGYLGWPTVMCALSTPRHIPHSTKSPEVLRK